MKKLRNEFMERFRAHFVQAKADSEQIGWLQHNLKHCHGLGQDHCKVKIDEAMEVLVTNQKRKKWNNKSKNDTDQENARAFAQGTENTFRCFCCAKKTCEGKRDCTHEDKPKSEWACCKAMECADKHSAMFAQDDNTQETNSITELKTQNQTNVSTTSSQATPLRMMRH